MFPVFSAISHCNHNHPLLTIHSDVPFSVFFFLQDSPRGGGGSHIDQNPNTQIFKRGAFKFHMIRNVAVTPTNQFSNYGNGRYYIIISTPPYGSEVPNPHLSIPLFFQTPISPPSPPTSFLLPSFFAPKSQVLVPVFVLFCSGGGGSGSGFFFFWSGFDEYLEIL